MAKIIKKEAREAEGFCMWESFFDSILKPQGYTWHHTSYARGYQTAKEARVDDYKGRFGEGYKIHIHSDRSSTYHLVMYYTKEA